MGVVRRRLLFCATVGVVPIAIALQVVAGATVPLIAPIDRSPSLKLVSIRLAAYVRAYTPVSPTCGMPGTRALCVHLTRNMAVVVDHAPLQLAIRVLRMQIDCDKMRHSEGDHDSQSSVEF